MLKHVLAFFVFIVVSLAPVSADEGYIPFFPDFLEPDGIGFRGPSEVKSKACWTTYDENYNCRSKPVGGTSAQLNSNVLVSSIKLEYR